MVARLDAMVRLPGRRNPLPRPVTSNGVGTRRTEPRRPIRVV